MTRMPSAHRVGSAGTSDGSSAGMPAAAGPASGGSASAAAGGGLPGPSVSRSSTWRLRSVPLRVTSPAFSSFWTKSRKLPEP